MNKKTEETVMRDNASQQTPDVTVTREGATATPATPATPAAAAK